MEFRKLYTNEVDSAYSIIESRFNFLKKKDIDQYPYPYPDKKTFSKQCKLENNYCLANDSSIVSIVTIEKTSNIGSWDYHDVVPFFWISAFYTKIDFSGNKIGLKMMGEIINHAQNQRIPYLLLDCYKVGGFLEKYYIDFGFIKMDEKLFQFPNRNFTASLMKYSL